MNNFYKDKQQVIEWLNHYAVKNYTLVPDEKYEFVVDVIGDVDLSSKNLVNIPVKFNEITGNFLCDNNKLTSLKFSPKTVLGSFWCNNNQLTSLEFCPQNIGSNFDCSDNQLTSLEFCPQTVGEKFYCRNNQKLKKIQEIIDFKLIYLEHKKILITRLSDKLKNELTNDNSKKTTKIKI